MTITDVERFASKFKTSKNCWEWTKGKNSHGYGGFYAEGKMNHAHRVMYRLVTGKEIPKGMHTDHLCRNTACVNPDHLEVVTHRENILRGNNIASTNSRKIHCPLGHEYSGDNLYTDKVGRRYCKTCRHNRYCDYRGKGECCSLELLAQI